MFAVRAASGVMAGIQRYRYGNGGRTAAVCRPVRRYWSLNLSPFRLSGARTIAALTPLPPSPLCRRLPPGLSLETARSYPSALRRVSLIVRTANSAQPNPAQFNQTRLDPTTISILSRSTLLYSNLSRFNSRSLELNSDDWMLLMNFRRRSASTFHPNKTSLPASETNPHPLIFVFHRSLFLSRLVCLLRRFNIVPVSQLDDALLDWRLLRFQRCLSVCFRVKNWALMFGVDLWEYGRQLTRMNELQRVSSMKSTCIALDMQNTFLSMLT